MEPPAQAFALMDESAGRWPADFQVQLMYALSLGRRGDRAAAERAFEKARSLRPDDPTLAGGLDGALARLAPQMFPGLQ